ncbi:MAG: o-succinylbenzoate synthase [Crocinitomicaceae bacterium]|nr:o-succinylbenzoate synthase [Crocinitomicaceae bacterium]
MLQSKIHKHTLIFKQASGTSRGVLHTKNSWIIELFDEANPSVIGKGEASIIENLSPDWNNDYENQLAEICKNVNEHVATNFSKIHDFPSIRFALESALLDLKNGGKEIYFPSEFTEGKKSISINGLIWMGSKEFMEQQIREKIEAGYSCIKLKIGTSTSLSDRSSGSPITFEDELDLLKSIRAKFSRAEMELRVDANGAFSIDEAPKKLDQLAKFDLHSIEQPIKQGQFEAMKKLCTSTPLPIALDEELIGVNLLDKKSELLSFIKPQYIILKPSLVGGFQSSDEWISIAVKNKIDWWITSALESNIGLNAIAQYTFTKNNPMPQGLGTGQLYTNNFPSGLRIEKGRLSLSNS